MLKSVLSVLILLCAGEASAQNCPAFYRFVDFGLERDDGSVYRGGPTFRAEGFDGQPLLLRGRTACRGLQDVAKDGRGNPIPVVTQISYDPDITNIDLTELTVSVTDNTEVLADQNAQSHRARLERNGTEQARGATFLCVRGDETCALSCQLKSPYPNNSALVVYCDALACEMPVLAITDRLYVSAAWPVDDDVLNDLGAAGAKIEDRIGEIYAFLRPLSADL